MRHTAAFTALLILLALCAPVVNLPIIHAQDPANAWTSGTLNLRSGPGGQHIILQTLASDTALVLEARTADGAWALGRTTDGAARGWLAVGYLFTATGFDVFSLPITDEIVAAASAPAEPGTDSGAPTRNGALASQELIHSTGHSEYYAISYWSDGLLINGYAGYPPGDGPFPVVIYNRGGAWNNGALTGRELVPLVESGYVAIGSQYRGNMGSGGNEQFGWDEVNDVLNLIPLIDALPNADGSRIGMMGGSRGGMVTYMALKAESLAGTHRIQVAATVGGLSDLFMWAEDNPRMVTDVYLPLIGATPAQNFAAFEMRSAVYWPELINTPVLLQHGEADAIVSPEQSRKLYAALVNAGKTAELMIFPGDDHPLSGQLGGYREAQRFFAPYLSRPGDPDRQYDSHWGDINATTQWFVQHGR